MSTETIAAVSSAFGEGAIALLRLSGPQAVPLVDGLFRGKKPVRQMDSRMQHFGGIFEGEQKLDDVLLSVHRAPHSYTGEDVVEINCHGGVLITRRLLELLLAQGARAAEPGEFTQRAYLAGKMDLTQAEAVMDLITAQTDLALRAASEQLEGRLGERIRSLQDALLGLLAHVEAYIDFPEEDIDPDTGEALDAKLQAIRAEIQELLATAQQGKILREGVRTVIYGEPNVGKSSLLNVLLGYERAIVSARPGTTRDVIEEVINLHGIPLRLVDTAGIRQSQDEIENQGMERTRREMQRADLILQVVDASLPMTVEAREFLALASGSPTEETRVLPAQRILVLNKVDLGEDPSWLAVEGVRISCLGAGNIGQLDHAIVALVSGGGTANRSWTVAINARHKACLSAAADLLGAAQNAMDEKLSPEFVAEELRGALQAVGEVIGRLDTEDLLGKIFSTFCIGK